MRVRKLDYKWVALSNTTLGMLMATINGSILLIALPDIFRGISVDPLAPGNTSYLLWLILGFLVVIAVLVVSLGRLGDIYGRVRMFNLGFAVFTVFSILLSVTWMHGSAGALWLILMRVGQGVGGALLFANSSAILTDAFPKDQRGLALGVNTIAAVAGSFIGLVLGGVLAPIAWRLVFLVSVPVGVFATVWSYRGCASSACAARRRSTGGGTRPSRSGSSRVMIGITYGIQPYGGHTMGWTSPFVLTTLIGGVALLAVFCLIELRVEEPMFHLELFRIRAFTAGNLAALLAAMGRGGLQFILIIWLQGIWLPRARLCLLAHATLGRHLHGAAASRACSSPGRRPGTSPTASALGRSRPAGCSSRRSASAPDRAAGELLLHLVRADPGAERGRHGPVLVAEQRRRDELPAARPARRRRGHARDVHELRERALDRGLLHADDRRALVGAAARAPERARSRTAFRRPMRRAISHLPPVATLFASFLGYNPIATLLGPHVLNAPAAGTGAALTGRSFFPHLISSPFHTALVYAFVFAIVACLVAAVASLLRGGKYHHVEADLSAGGGGLDPRRAARGARIA